MAVVAFPFTCITSDDIEGEDGYHLISHCETRKDEELADNDCDNTAASASSGSTVTSAPSLADSVPSAVSLIPEQPLEDEKHEMVKGGGDPIDDVFFDELNHIDSDDHSRNPDLDEDHAVSMEAEAVHESEQNISFTNYGGLRNLGNTCYLASALQMLASLDTFVDNLKRSLPPTSTDMDENENPTETHVPLRDSFLKVMESLCKGETISPSDFKSTLDEKTPLFLGYFQQDSHEFLTTLLDLIDEEYKEKQKDEDQDKKSSSDEEGVEMEEAMEIMYSEQDAACIDNKTQDSSTDARDAQMLGETAIQEEQINRSENHKVDSRSESSETEAKRALDLRSDETWQPADEAVAASTIKADIDPSPVSVIEDECRNFSELQPDGIEALIHAPLLNSDRSAATTVVSVPKCKLIGGRMSSVDAEHALRFGNDDVSISIEPMEQDENNESTSASSVVSPVEAQFKTEVRVRLTCDSCKYTRCHTENFFHLSLEIGVDNNSVDDGIRKFFSPERREVKCEKCFCESALQTMEITRLPPALLLHFKRFIVDVSPDYSSVTYRKNQSTVAFDDKLDVDEQTGGSLGEFLASDVSLPDHEAFDDTSASVYKLRSIVNHIGSSASCGHYTADAARLYPNGDRVWTRFNDSYVSRMDDNPTNFSSSTAYMVMYEI